MSIKLTKLPNISPENLTESEFDYTVWLHRPETSSLTIQKNHGKILPNSWSEDSDPKSSKSSTTKNLTQV